MRFPSKICTPPPKLMERGGENKGRTEKDRGVGGGGGEYNVAHLG